jgi:hypothetical protein
MGNLNFSKQILSKLILWGAICFSTIALMYNIRWFIPFLINNIAYVVPNGQSPLIWFIVQICNNLIFLYVSYLLIKLLRRYQQVGFFEKECIVVFQKIIMCCVVLAILGILKLGFSNYNDVQIGQLNMVSGFNSFIRFFINILVFKEPQTMYLLIATMLWVVKQFVTKAIFVKAENEKFI